MLKYLIAALMFGASITFANAPEKIDLGVIGLDECNSKDANFKFLSDLQASLVKGGKKADLEFECGKKGWLPNGDFSSHVTQVTLKLNSEFKPGKNWLGEVPRKFFYTHNGGHSGNYYRMQEMSYISHASTSGAYMLNSSLSPDHTGACGNCDKAYFVLIVK